MTAYYYLLARAYKLQKEVVAAIISFAWGRWFMCAYEEKGAAIVLAIKVN